MLQKQKKAQDKIDAEEKRLADERKQLEADQAEEKRKKEADAEAERKRKEKAEADAKRAKYPGSQAITDALEGADQAAEDHPMPKTLRRMIQKRLKDSPAEPWDKVVARIAEKAVADGEM